MNAIKEDPDATASEGEAEAAAPEAAPLCACCAKDPRSPAGSSYCNGCATFRSSFTGAKEILAADGIDVDKAASFAFNGAKTSHADFIRSMVRARGRAKGAKAISEEIKAHLATLNVRVRGTKRTLTEVNADATAAAALMQLGGPSGAASAPPPEKAPAPHTCLMTRMNAAIRDESKLRANRRQLTAGLEVATQLRDACSAYLERLKALAPAGGELVVDAISKTEADLATKEAVRGAAADALAAAAPIEPMVEATNAAFQEVNTKIREAAAYTERMRR